MKLVKLKHLRIYKTKEGIIPFEKWINSLSDLAAKQKIDQRLTRLQCGNLGDCKSVGEGVSELRINFGPGYRIYFGQDGDSLIILLFGGDKRTQSKDIKTAINYWNEFKERKKKDV
jgi:putative addiction module killer protein